MNRIVIAMFISFGLCSAAPISRPSHRTSLRILLVNDQGDTKSFRVLRDKLAAAGHRVKAYIPSNHAASFGAAFTGRELNLIRIAQNTWKVENESLVDSDNEDEPFPGTPVECLQVGLKHFGDSVDLVVSGFNDPTYSSGSFTILSGGIAAALVSTIRSQAFNSKVPSLAVSISGEPSENRVNKAAEFVVNLINTLHESREDGQLLPPFTTLSINVPGHDPDNPQKDMPVMGVSLNRSGISASLEDGEEMFLSSNNVPDVGTLIRDSRFNDIPFSDAVDRNQGWVTMVVMNPDLTATSTIFHDLSKRLREDILTKRSQEEDLTKNLDALDLIVESKKKNSDKVRKTRVDDEDDQDE